MIACLSGSASPEEEADLERWISEDPVRGELFHSLREIATMTGRLPHRHDADAAWLRLRARMKSAPPRAGEPIPLRPRPASTHSRSHDRGGVAAARTTLLRMAAVLGMIAAAALLWTTLRGTTAAPEMREVATAPGQRSTVTLGDGSEVELGPDSRLRVPVRFDRRTRHVEVEGAAYFRVIHDPRRPFEVHAKGSATRVLGTEFSVRAYPDEVEVSVAVREGSVALGAIGASGAAVVVLGAGDVGNLLPDGTAEVRPATDLDLHLGWTHGRLAFQNERLSRVVLELSRWYGVDIRLGDPQLGSRRLTVVADSEPLDEVLRRISLSLDLHHQRVGSVITLGQRPTDP